MMICVMRYGGHSCNLNDTYETEASNVHIHKCQKHYRNSISIILLCIYIVHYKQWSEADDSRGKELNELKSHFSSFGAPVNESRFASDFSEADAGSSGIVFSPPLSLEVSFPPL